MIPLAILCAVLVAVVALDERHKGKMDNQAAWQAARDEWDAKVKGVKA